MRKILILCVAFILLVSGVASAKISTGEDSFTNGFSVSSSIFSESVFDLMSFSKNIFDGVHSYEIYIAWTGMKNFILADLPIELKVDGYPVYELDKYRYKAIGPDTYGVKYNSSITAKIPVEIVDKIKNAKRVAIQFEFTDGTQVPYVLPESTLAEWKQVINTTE